MKKKRKEEFVKNFFATQRFYTLYERKFSNVRQLISNTFPKDSKNQKSLDIGLWEVVVKKPFNGVKNADTKKCCSEMPN